MSNIGLNVAAVEKKVIVENKTVHNCASHKTTHFKYNVRRAVHKLFRLCFSPVLILSLQSFIYLSSNHYY